MLRQVGLTNQQTYERGEGGSQVRENRQGRMVQAYVLPVPYPLAVWFVIRYSAHRSLSGLIL
jgi:hypothetical protein